MWRWIVFRLFRALCGFSKPPVWRWIKELFDDLFKDFSKPPVWRWILLISNPLPSLISKPPVWRWIGILSQKKQWWQGLPSKNTLFTLHFLPCYNWLKFIPIFIESKIRVIHPYRLAARLITSGERLPHLTDYSSHRYSNCQFFHPSPLLAKLTICSHFGWFGFLGW